MTGYGEEIFNRIRNALQKTTETLALQITIDVLGGTMCFLGKRTSERVVLRPDGIEALTENLGEFMGGDLAVLESGVQFSNSGKGNAAVVELRFRLAHEESGFEGESRLHIHRHHDLGEFHAGIVDIGIGFLQLGFGRSRGRSRSGRSLGRRF